MLSGAGVEGQPTIFGGDPPNTQLQTFGQKLEELDALIWSDGMFGPEEQRLFAAWMFKQKTKIMQLQEQAAAGAAGGAPASPQPGPAAPQEQAFSMGYGSGGGSEYVP